MTRAALTPEQRAAENRARIEAARAERRLRPKPQNFDNSELPLFGDGHKQIDLFRS